jgi:hypothetical protein
MGNAWRLLGFEGLGYNLAFLRAGKETVWDTWPKSSCTIR